MKKSIEATIQRELVKWIKKEYPFIEVKYNKNENKRDALQAVIDKKMGQTQAGYPDLTLLTNNQGLTFILELELKTKTGKLNDAQKKWHKDFKSTKNRVAKIAYGFLESQTIISEWYYGTNKKI